MRYPASFQQGRLWFLEQLDPGQPTWNMPYAYWIDGPLDPGALQRALDAVVARHATLRTCLVATDGLPEQVTDPAATVAVQVIELDGALPQAYRIAHAESVAASRAVIPFDLAAGPLLRVTLIAAGPALHLLVLVMHHAISDGESVQLLIGELSACYRAEATRQRAALPELWMAYGDYAAWQRDRMRGEELDRQLAYWREQLRGAPQALMLPADRPRPARMSARGGQAQATIGAAATSALAELGASASATMFMVILAGFAAVLSRYAREADLTLGTQVAGRTHAELEPLIGLFTNTVPLRVTLPAETSFTQLLRQVKDATVDAMAHQEAPFEKIIDALVSHRSLSVPALVQAQFLYGSLTPPALEIPGALTRGRALLTGTSKTDLTLYADCLDGQSTTLTLEYSTDLWDCEWAEQFTRCVATLLASAAQAPGTAVADLPMLSAGERDALVSGRNPEPSPPGGAGRAELLRLIQASASTVCFGQRSVPASELRDRAARIARVLAGHGVGPDTPVGLCITRGPGMLAALLGVWWAGGGYVPLDPGLPPARLAVMAQAAGLQVIVADAAQRELARSAAPGATVICADDPDIAALPPLEPVPAPDNALAYVIFTSGSTGQPKGVAVEHRGLASQLLYFRQALGVTRLDRVLAISTLSFDISVIELLLPLVSDARLVIATAQDSREADRLRALISDAGATVVQGTPQTWRMLQQAGGVPGCVRLRLTGGEPLPADLAAALLAPGAAVWNLYGPTETTIWAAASAVDSPATAAQVGPPIDQMRACILDERLQPVPAGVVGEVFLAGPGVARGYHGQPRLTARAFRPDPFAGVPGSRMYATGDLGRWRQGARVELAGRNDHQVKIRGFRIECGEVEAVLRAHRDVRQAAVHPADRGGELALVGYVVPRPNSAIAAPGADLLQELGPHLHAALPAYMVPSLLMALSALPLTATAKVDRKALPAPPWGGPAAAARRRTPSSGVEATLAQIWSELLSLQEPPGAHDDLFALGGHSLTATRLVARIASTFGVSLAVHEVFTRPTIAGLAEAISASPQYDGVPASPRDAELAALSDGDLDDLLRAVIAQRAQRQARERE